MTVAVAVTVVAAMIEMTTPAATVLPEGVLRGKRKELAQIDAVLRAAVEAPSLAVALALAMRAEHARRDVTAIPVHPAWMLMQQWEREAQYAPLRRLVYGSETPFDQVVFATAELADKKLAEQGPRR